MNRDYFLQTKRIGFSKWTDAVLPLARQLWGDPDVTRLICASGRFTPREQRYRLNPLGYRCSLAPFTIAFFCFTPRSSSVSTSVSRPRAAPLIAASGNSMSPR